MKHSKLCLLFLVLSLSQAYSQFSYQKKDGQILQTPDNPIIGMRIYGTSPGQALVIDQNNTVVGGIGGATGVLPTQLLAPLHLWGDSIMQGTGCSLYQFCVGGLLMSAHAGPALNHGLGGDQASDEVIHVVQQYSLADQTKPTPLSVVQAVINNANGCGVSASCQTNFSEPKSATIALLGLLPQYQVLGSSCTFTGSWSTDSSTYAPYSTYTSTTQGNSISCQVVTSGNPVGVIFSANSSGVASSTCTTDGQGSTAITMSSSQSFGKTTSTLWRNELAATAPGTHTVVCTVASPTSSSNPATFLMMDSVPKGVTATLPPVVVTNGTSVGGVNDSATAIFAGLASTVASRFIAEGLNVFFADTRTPSINANFYFSGNGTAAYPGFGAGGLHPDDGGHAAMAAAIELAAPAYFLPNAGGRALGVSPGPFIGWGGYGLSSTSQYSTGNASGSYPGEGPIVAGGWSVYPGNYFDFAGWNGSNLPSSIFGTDGLMVRISTSNNPFCFSEYGNVVSNSGLAYHTCKPAGGGWWTDQSTWSRNFNTYVNATGTNGNQATAGDVLIPAGSTSVSIVNGGQILTGNPQIFLTSDSSPAENTRMASTCNSTPQLLSISARSTGSFTISTPTAPTTNPLCVHWFIVNGNN